jgi:hypothetical protein
VLGLKVFVQSPFEQGSTAHDNLPI